MKLRSRELLLLQEFCDEIKSLSEKPSKELYVKSVVYRTEREEEDFLKRLKTIVETLKKEKKINLLALCYLFNTISMYLIEWQKIEKYSKELADDLTQNLIKQLNKFLNKNQNEDHSKMISHLFSYFSIINFTWEMLIKNKLSQPFINAILFKLETFTPWELIILTKTFALIGLSLDGLKQIKIKEGNLGEVWLTTIYKKLRGKDESELHFGGFLKRDIPLLLWSLAFLQIKKTDLGTQLIYDLFYEIEKIKNWEMEALEKLRIVSLWFDLNFLPELMEKIKLNTLNLRTQTSQLQKQVATIIEKILKEKLVNKKLHLEHLYKNEMWVDLCFLKTKSEDIEKLHEWEVIKEDLIIEVNGPFPYHDQARDQFKERLIGKLGTPKLYKVDYMQVKQPEKLEKDLRKLLIENEIVRDSPAMLLIKASSNNFWKSPASKSINPQQEVEVSTSKQEAKQAEKVVHEIKNDALAKQEKPTQLKMNPNARAFTPFNANAPAFTPSFSKK